MFTLIIAVIVFIIAGVFIVISRLANDSEWMAGCRIFSVVGLVAVGFAIFMTLDEYSSQRSEYEEVIKLTNCEMIYNSKSDALTKQFASYLANAYPEYEKNIFEKIKPENVDIYLVKYPDLKASQTIIALVEQISKLQNDIYDQKLEKESVLKDMRYRIKNPWIFNSWIPSYEELESAK